MLTMIRLTTLQKKINLSSSNSTKSSRIVMVVKRNGQFQKALNLGTMILDLLSPKVIQLVTAHIMTLQRIL